MHNRGVLRALGFAYHSGCVKAVWAQTRARKRGVSQLVGTHPECPNRSEQRSALHVEKDAVGRLLDSVDQRHAQLTALTAKLLPARAEYYRAYENYVAVLAKEFGAYQVVSGQFIFQLQGTVDRYNSAAHAMVVAARRVADLQEERKGLAKSQPDGWEKIVSGK